MKILKGTIALAVISISMGLVHSVVHAADSWQFTKDERYDKNQKITGLYEFTITQGPTSPFYADIFSSFTSSKSTVSGFDIETFDLVNSSGVTLARGTDTDARGTFDKFVINYADSLNAGKYSLTLSGKGNNTSTLASNFTYSTGTVTVSPVPEPETYAMLLAGLGVLCIARRKAIFGKLQASAKQPSNLFMPA